MNTSELGLALGQGEWFDMDTSLGDEAGSKWSDYRKYLGLAIGRPVWSAFCYCVIIMLLRRKDDRVKHLTQASTDCPKRRCQLDVEISRSNSLCVLSRVGLRDIWQ